MRTNLDPTATRPLTLQTDDLVSHGATSCGTDPGPDPSWYWPPFPDDEETHRSPTDG